MEEQFQNLEKKATSPYLTYGLGRDVVLFDSPQENETLWKYPIHNSGKLTILAQDENHGFIAAQGRVYRLGKRDAKLDSFVNIQQEITTMAIADKALFLLGKSFNNRTSVIYRYGIENCKDVEIWDTTFSVGNIIEHNGNLLAIPSRNEFGAAPPTHRLSDNAFLFNPAEGAHITASAAGKYIYLGSESSNFMPATIAYTALPEAKPVGMQHSHLTISSIAANNESAFVLDYYGTLQVFNSELTEPRKNIWQDIGSGKRGIPAMQISPNGAKIYWDGARGISAYDVIDNEGKITITRRM